MNTLEEVNLSPVCETKAQPNGVHKNGRHHETGTATTTSPFFLLLDPRAVALVRIGLAICSLSEWYVAFASREAFLSDDGMMPRKVWLDVTQGDIYKTHSINVWMAAGSAEAVLVLLLVQLLFSVGLLMGYYSRVCSLVLFLFINSLNVRLDTKNGGGLEVLSVFLLWGVWLPLGDSYSLDTLRKPKADEKGLSSGGMCLEVVERMTEALVTLRDRFVSVAIPLHMAVMYYSCGVVKDTEHWNTGNAVLLVVNCGQQANQPFASIMARLPMLCRLLTYGTYYIETYGGFVLLVPSAEVRMTALVLLLPFHLGMHLALDIGTFQPTMMAALLLFILTQGCDVLVKGVRAVWQRAVVLCEGSRKQRAGILLRTGQQAKAVGRCLGAASVVAMVLVLITLTMNDLCLHLGHITKGKHACWLGIGKPYHAFVRRWAPILGMPQNHSPYQDINTWEDYFHIVGVVEGDEALAKDTCPVSGICENDEKAVAILTDKMALQLNFNDSVLWSPDQHPHVNICWWKFFEDPRTLENSADGHLADYLCRRWNRRPGHPKMKSVATVRIWKEMTARHGSLDFSPYKYSIVSHFKCSDHGQSGLASNATLIHDKMKEVFGTKHTRIILENNVRYPLLVYWVHPETGREIVKGRVREQQVRDQARWIQDAEPGAPEGSHAEKGLLAQVIEVGKTKSKVVIEPKLEWEILVENHGRYPLLAYWVHYDTGEEIAKGRIHKHSIWDQKAELGDIFRFYWDLPDGTKLLAQEFKVEAENEPIVISDNPDWEIPLQNASNYAPENDGLVSSARVLGTSQSWHGQSS